MTRTAITALWILTLIAVIVGADASWQAPRTRRARLGAEARVGRADQGQHPCQGRAPVPRREEPVSVPQDPLPLHGEEHHAVAHAVRHGQSDVGAKAGFEHACPRCVRSLKNGTKGPADRRFAVALKSFGPALADFSRWSRRRTSAASLGTLFLRIFLDATAVAAIATAKLS